MRRGYRLGSLPHELSTLFGHTPHRKESERNGRSTVLVRGSNWEEQKKWPEITARPADRTIATITEIVNKESRVIYAPTILMVCDPNDGSFPTRASLNDSTGGVGVPRGLNLTVASSPSNKSCTMWAGAAAYGGGYILMPIRTIRS